LTFIGDADFGRGEYTMSKKIVIIVPAFNEEDSIGTVLKELHTVAEQLRSAGNQVSIWVIDDGSKDSTREVARAAGVNKLLRHRTNMGLGAAVRTGIIACKQVGADIMVKIDGDLQHSPGDIPSLLTPIVNDTADIVYGSRFEKINYRMSFPKRIGNLLFSRLMSWLTGWPISDSQPGMFAICCGCTDGFYIPGDYNYTQQILLNAYHSGLRFAQVPITFNARTSGRSFVSAKYPFMVALQILRVLLQIKPLQVFGVLGGVFASVAIGVFVFELYGWFFLGALKPRDCNGNCVRARSVPPGCYSLLSSASASLSPKIIDS
jgi:glycosyltransferase involved in cell wall biosynthesis